MAKRSFNSSLFPAGTLYSTAVISHGLAFISGMGPTDPATGLAIEGDFPTQMRRVLDNLGLVLGELGCTFTNVVKVNIYLRDIADFPRANEVYTQYFTQSLPARTTVQAGALPGGIAVEIELVVDCEG